MKRFCVAVESIVMVVVYVGWLPALLGGCSALQAASDARAEKAEAAQEARFIASMTPVQRLEGVLLEGAAAAPDEHDQAGTEKQRRFEAASNLMTANEGHVPDAALMKEAQSVMALPLASFDKPTDLWTPEGRRNAALKAALASE